MFNNITYTEPDPTKVRPIERKEHIGRRAIFQCQSAGEIKWFYEKKALPQNAYHSLDGRTLSIRQIHINNAGTYHCLGKDHMRRQFLSPSTLIPIGNLMVVYSILIINTENITSDRLMCKIVESAVTIGESNLISQLKYTILINMDCFFSSLSTTHYSS